MERQTKSSGREDSGRRKLTSEEERRLWLEENAAAFAAQSEWHAKNGHPLKDIMMGPAGDAWRRRSKS